MVFHLEMSRILFLGRSASVVLTGLSCGIASLTIIYFS